MAFPITYAGWISYIRDWLAADEYSDAQVSSFMDLAQLRLNREMMSYGMEADAPITVVSASPIVILSEIPDFSKVRLVSVPGFGPLEAMAINEIKKKLETDPRDGQASEFYCIDAGKLYTYPAMSAGTIDFYYYRKIPSLSKTPPVNTNVFSEEYPDALLYASLLAASPYMKDKDGIGEWSDAYVGALATANSTSNKIKLGSTPLVRRPVVQQ